MSEDLTFIFSKALDNPDSFFQGYCFQGVDYIVGEEGAKSYASDVEGSVQPAQDGCYVSVARIGSNYEFSTDYSGNKKVFFFWSPAFWAVSNSLSLLVAHLREHGITVSANRSQLRIIGVGGRSSALNQLSSFSTAVEGVFLAPALCTLSIGVAGVSLKPVAFASSAGYGEALSTFCEVWLARLQALLLGGIEISSDLTGGADSRAVLSLILAAAQHASLPLDRVKFRSGSVAGDMEDLEVATEICGALGLQLNVKSSRRRRRLSSSESYAAWKALCLGVYHPIYFPKFSVGQGVVSLGGGGGENHRRFYKNASFDDLIQSCARKLSGDVASREFAVAMGAAGERLCAMEGADSDALIVHYRNFRHRFHTGRSPQHSIVFSPLGSRYLEDASRFGGAERIRMGQVNYDIMFSMAPETLDFRFDGYEKRLTQERKKLLTEVALPSTLLVGKVYGVNESEGGQEEVPTSESLRPLDFLWDEVQECAKSQVLKDFWSPSFVRDVEKAAEKAHRAGRFGHAIDGQNVSALLTSRMVL